MKQFSLSLAAVLAMSTFAIAGGDIAPVEPEVMVPEVVESTPGSFYIGLGYSAVSAEDDWDAGEVAGSYDVDYDALMLQAGYQINQYLAIEGRYWTSLGDGEWSWTDGRSSLSGDNNGDELTAWGIYVKPMYPIGESFNVYGLLGYGNVSLSNDGDGDYADENGFQWGLGAAYAFTENLSVFVDYVSMYDDDGDWLAETHDLSVDSWNFGLTYKF